MRHPEWIVPEWEAPGHVHARVTTRAGGVSRGAFARLNLALHVGDDGNDVLRNRALLAVGLPSQPVWLNQVHGTDVARIDCPGKAPRADAAVAARPGRVCAVMTADCLPVLFCARDGSVVGAAHAGWRGLAAGVLEATVARMQVAPEALLAWFGPAIGPEAFEVGADVRERFVSMDARARHAFVPGAGEDKWLADIFTLARQRLQRIGVRDIYGGGLCTVADEKRFFSYRRDGVTGRFATLIWRE